MLETLPNGAVQLHQSAPDERSCVTKLKEECNASLEPSADWPLSSSPCRSPPGRGASPAQRRSDGQRAARSSSATGGPLVLSTPVPVNPAAGNADRCIRSSAHHVLAPALIQDGEITCTVDQNTSILAARPQHRVQRRGGAALLRRRPRARAAPARSRPTTASRPTRSASTAASTTSAATACSTPDRKVRLPEDDVFGLDARSMRFTADGWAALISPLPPGHHVITVRSARRDVRRQPDRLDGHAAAGGRAPVASAASSPPSHPASASGSPSSPSPPSLGGVALLRRRRRDDRLPVRDGRARGAGVARRVRHRAVGEHFGPG